MPNINFDEAVITVRVAENTDHVGGGISVSRMSIIQFFDAYDPRVSLKVAIKAAEVMQTYGTAMRRTADNEKWYLLRRALPEEHRHFASNIWTTPLVAIVRTKDTAETTVVAGKTLGEMLDAYAKHVDWEAISRIIRQLSSRDIGTAFLTGGEHELLLAVDTKNIVVPDDDEVEG